jgi:hypothetical protein
MPIWRAVACKEIQISLLAMLPHLYCKNLAPISVWCSLGKYHSLSVNEMQVLSIPIVYSNKVNTF